MVDFISELYSYAKLIPEIKNIISLCYQNAKEEVKTDWGNLVPTLLEFCNIVASENPNLSAKLMSSCEEACSYTNGEVSNYSLMGDKLTEAIPLLYDSMSILSNIDVTEGDYRLFSSKSGFISLENTQCGHIYHSSLDPISEAKEKAAATYNEAMTTFYFAGCGLGYLPYELFKLSDESCNIEIYHTSKEVIQYAIDYGYLGLIPESKVSIHVLDTMSDLTNTLNSISFEDIDNGYYVSEDLLDLASLSEQNELISHTAYTHTRASFDRFLSINLWQNIKNVSKTIYKMPFDKTIKEYIVVAAGPSLDSKMDYLKSAKETAKIICASTVYKKLTSNGIIPDYVCVSDPQSRTFMHLSDVDTKNSTLLLEATSNWRFGEYFEGPKYLVPSSSSRAAYDYFNSLRVKPFTIVGSVSYMCVLMADFLGATKINLVGLDLAYPNGDSHASGTMDSHKVNTDKMIEVPSVNGGMVFTTPQFKIYIDTMNELFASMKNTVIVNHSDIGAKFANTYKHTLL